VEADGTDRLTAPHSPARRPGERAPWQTWRPLGLVVVSLVALAVLPGLVARRTEALRREVADGVTPPRRDLHAFGLAFAREVLAFRAWLLTHDPAFAEEFRRSRADGDRSLDAAARGLSGTDLSPSVAELRSTVEGWRAGVATDLEGRPA